KALKILRNNNKGRSRTSRTPQCETAICARWPVILAMHCANEWHRSKKATHCRIASSGKFVTVHDVDALFLQKPGEAPGPPDIECSIKRQHVGFDIKQAKLLLRPPLYKGHSLRLEATTQ